MTDTPTLEELAWGVARFAHRAACMSREEQDPTHGIILTALHKAYERGQRDGRQVLKPSAETKAALMGEFYIPLPDVDDNGDEHMRRINVPWTTIKEIMHALAAIPITTEKED